MVTDECIQLHGGMGYMSVSGLQLQCTCITRLCTMYMYMYIQVHVCIFVYVLYIALLPHVYTHVHECM